MTPKEINTCIMFLERLEKADRKMNPGEFQHYMFPINRYNELMYDFTEEQREVIIERIMKLPW